MKAANREAMVIGSFLGDSLALGAHWIYDVEEIGLKFGRVDQLLKPLMESYHPTKDAGEFTHYGDQALILLESLASKGAFDLDDFALRWRGLFERYKGYVDHATKGTLGNFAAGKGPGESGSTSSDLAGAARIAPLVHRYAEDAQTLESAARAQTAMTHNNPVVIRKAAFFARVAYTVLEGKHPVEAIRNVCDAHFEGTSLEESVRKALESAVKPTSEAILFFGQSCDARGAFPATLHLIARYENNLKEALVENVMAGGDSAARGMLVGMVLGAHLGMDAIPSDWLASLKMRDHILGLLAKLKQA